MTLAAEAPARRDTIRYQEPERELPDGIRVNVSTDDGEPDESGLVYNEDGSVTVQEPEKKVAKGSKNFDVNLAEAMDETELGSIASELLEAIAEDKRSRLEWEETVSKGIDLLGLKIETQGSEVTSSGAIARAKSTLLLEAVLKYQSNFNAEMLPADGPVKVRDDKVQASSTPPETRAPPVAAGSAAPGLGHNGGPPMEPPGMAMGGVPPAPPQMPPPPMGGMGQPGMPKPPMGGMAPPPPALGAFEHVDLAQAFEKDFNYYLVVGDPIFYPDTDRMSFSQGLAGCAFKKIYRDPLENMPVSRFCMAQHVIVNNGASSLHDAKRITHEIPNMSARTLKQMMMAGVYREVDVSTPFSDQKGPVDTKIAETEGRQPHVQRPDDRDHDVMECYCYRNLVGFEEKGDLPVPYRITIEKDSQQVLEIRRDWKKGDKNFKRRRHFVKYGLFPGLGFYDYGYVHLLGNTTRILSAIESMMCDQGMFANFPGGLIDRSATSRQDTNQFRPAPGGFKSIDTGGRPISSVVMALPYKDVSANLMALVKGIDQDARNLGSIAELPIAEGRGDLPVGTVLALLENSKVLISAVHRRNFASQHEEFEILKELFAEDPKALSRLARNPARQWETAEEFEDVDLVPMADPNTSSKVQRLGKATALVQILQQSPPGLLNAKEILTRTFKIMELEDIDALFAPPPPPGSQPPAPHVVDAQAKQAQLMAKLQSDQQNNQTKLQLAQMESQQKAAQLVSDEKIEAERLIGERIKHSNDSQQEWAQHVSGLQQDQAQHSAELNQDTMKHVTGLQQAAAQPPSSGGAP